MPRILALDYGKRRTGYALSDPGARLVGRSGHLECGSVAALRDAVLELCRSESVDEAVIGVPLHMDGSSSPMAESVESFIALLESAGTLKLHRWDERLSSAEAGARLDEIGGRPRRRDGRTDAMAASLMLEGFLEKRRLRSEERS
jgi:putative Holliday junction resolvase